MLTAGGEVLAGNFRVTDECFRPLLPCSLLSGHEDSVVGVAFSPNDGTYLATGDMAGGVQVWRYQPADTNQWFPHQTLQLGDLLWLKWWTNPTSSRGDGVGAGGSQPPCGSSTLVLLAGSEDSMVSASLVTSNPNNERPTKYLTGK